MFSKVLPRVDENSYRHNLEEIAKQCKQNNVPLIFVLLKDNPLQTELLNEGIEKLSMGDQDGAIRALHMAVDLNNMFSHLARLYLARALEAAGRRDEAQLTLNSSYEHSLTGGRPVRLDRDYNQIMREVGIQYNVPVVDAGKVLDEHPWVYVDCCHFNAAGHRKVAELLAPEILKILGEKK